MGCDFYQAVFDVVRIVGDGSIVFLLYCIAVGVVGERYAIIAQKFIVGIVVPIPGDPRCRQPVSNRIVAF